MQGALAVRMRAMVREEMRVAVRMKSLPVENATKVCGTTYYRFGSGDYLSIRHVLSFAKIWVQRDVYTGAHFNTQYSIPQLNAA